jgi:hypothetical protein
MPFETLAPAMTCLIAGAGLIGDRGIELLQFIRLSSKPDSISCRSSSTK